jgi:hypothetical protein
MHAARRQLTHEGDTMLCRCMVQKKLNLSQMQPCCVYMRNVGMYVCAKRTRGQVTYCVEESGTRDEERLIQVLLVCRCLFEESLHRVPMCDHAATKKT